MKRLEAAPRHFHTTGSRSVSESCVNSLFGEGWSTSVEPSPLFSQTLSGRAVCSSLSPPPPPPHTHTMPDPSSIPRERERLSMDRFVDSKHTFHNIITTAVGKRAGGVVELPSCIRNTCCLLYPATQFSVPSSSVSAAASSFKSSFHLMNFFYFLVPEKKTSNPRGLVVFDSYLSSIRYVLCQLCKLDYEEVTDAKLLQ